LLNDACYSSIKIALKNRKFIIFIELQKIFDTISPNFDTCTLNTLFLPLH
jgi:hypothetical protein